MHDDDDNDNINLFRETLQPIIVQRLLPASKAGRKRVKGRKNEIKRVEVQSDDTKSIADLIEFVEYLADEIFEVLPDDLRTLTYAKVQNDNGIADKYTLPLSSEQVEMAQTRLPPSTLDSLLAYGIVADESEQERLVESLLTAYISAAVAVPPEYAPTDGQARPEGCEICDRTQLPLTYHHLIPRAVHEKAVKRGWHGDWELNKVAWLCRACHSFVHKVATNEELARSYYSIELLLARDDVQRWATWAMRIRWKAR